MKRTYVAGLCFFVLASTCTSLLPYLQPFTQKQIAPSVTYTKYSYTNSNNTVVHVVELDQDKNDCSISTAINQRDTVSDMAKRTEAIVAINGANYRRGGPFNGCRLNLLYSVDALCYTGNGYSGSIVIDQQHNLSLDYCKAQPCVMLHTKEKKHRIELDGINVPKTQHSTILYYPSFCNRYLILENDSVAIIKDRWSIETYKTPQKIGIPSAGCVILFDKSKFDTLNIQTINKLHFDINLIYKSPHPQPRTVLGGAGMLIKNGQPCNLYHEFNNYKPNIHFTDEAAADFANSEQQKWLIEKPHPRTAIGKKANGTIVLLVADGRLKSSAGLTLKETQDIFLTLDCNDALNLGGGGCSTLVINNRVVNNPSQLGERPVSEALCFYSKT